MVEAKIDRPTETEAARIRDTDKDANKKETDIESEVRT